MRILPYFKEHFRHVQPQSIFLGKNKHNKQCSYQYVPINLTLTSLLNDASVWKEFKTTENSAKQTTQSKLQSFSDCTDGSPYKNNVLFNENPNAIKIILYQDAFEVCNAPGSGKKKK